MSSQLGLGMLVGRRAMSSLPAPEEFGIDATGIAALLGIQRKAYEKRFVPRAMGPARPVSAIAGSSRDQGFRAQPDFGHAESSYAGGMQYRTIAPVLPPGLFLSHQAFELWTKYPILRRAITYYHENSQHLHNQSAATIGHEIAMYGLGYSNKTNTAYMSCRVREAFALGGLTANDALDQTEDWTPAKSFWTLGGVVDIAANGYRHDPGKYGRNDVEVCLQLAKEMFGDSIRRVKLVGYVASRIYNAFKSAHPQVWREDLERSAGVPDGYVEEVTWFDRLNGLTRPRWLPFVHELPQDVKGHVHVYGPPADVLPDFGT